MQSFFFKTYIRGVGAGYAWANSFLVVIRKEDRMFCVPGKLALDKENYMAILDGHISRHAYGEDDALEFILLRALSLPAKT